MAELLVLRNPIEFKHSLKTHIYSENVLSTILQMVVNIPSLKSLKLDIELTLHICKLIESLMQNIKEKIDKKQLCIEILITLFPELSDDEKKLLGNQVQFLFNNKKIKIVKTILGRIYNAGKFIYKLVMNV